MKARLLNILLCAFLFPAISYAQGGTWVWVKGTTAGITVYGTKGIANVNNTPGPAADLGNWNDMQGNFWLLQQSDMWKFDPLNNVWIWMNGPGSAVFAGVYGTQGLASSSNYPGSRTNPVTWSDNSGNLWLWGGYGYDAGGASGDLNDLWKYNTATNQWTWVKGSTSAALAQDVYGTFQTAATANTPGGRNACSGWHDNGNLWLFGGYGTTGVYNDMWKYSIASNQWTWMKGPQGAEQPGSYGVMGIETPANVPPPRASYTQYKDGSGNFYFWSGYYDAQDLDYSDVWRFNPNTNNWTWVAGSSQLGYAGNYQSYCTDNGPTGPMARWDNSSAALSSCSKVFLAFGGENEGVEEGTNDLWLYNPQTAQWRWISGSSTGGSNGSYGTLNVANASNMPPARQGQNMWVDNNGVLWLFSGYGFNTVADDMWKFIPNISCVQDTLSGGIQYQYQSNIICLGDSELITLSDISQASISPSNSVTWIDSLHAYLHPNVSTNYVITGNSVCRNSDSAFFNLAVTHMGILNYQLSDSQICAGSPAVLNFIGQANISIWPSSSVTWLDSTSVLLSPDSTTTYHIHGLSTLCGGNDSAVITISVVQHDPVNVTITDSVVCYGSTAEITVTGLSNIWVTPNYYSQFLDSTHILVSAYYSIPLVISGYNSCGGLYRCTINYQVVFPGTINYQLSKPDICLGDSSFLSLFGVVNPQIFPASRVSWTDSVHAFLNPDTTTTYKVYGQSICGGVDSVAFTVYVLRPGQVTYTLSNPYVCAGYNTYLYTYGLKNVQITPTSNLYYIDSVDAYSYLYPTTTTTYTITGQSICGELDSTQVTVYVTPYPNYNLSRPFICRGDTASLSIAGIYNAQITPSTNLQWLDSANVVLHPDTTTTYTITGYSCYGPVSYPVTLQVGRTGVLNYTLSTPGVCPGSSTTLTIYGDSIAQITPYLPLYWTSHTSAYSYLYPNTTTTYVITGVSVCGGRDTARVTVPVIPYSNYLLSRPTICKGDSSKLSVTGLTNIQITPFTGLTWIDSAFDSVRVMLAPDTTTTYIITGFDCSGYPTYNYLTLNVVLPGVLNYSVSDTVVCAGNYVYIYLNGVTSAQMTPPAYLYWTDSTDAYTYIYPDSTVTYNITGQSVCGGTVSATTTIHVNQYASYALSRSSICAGASATLNLTGISNAHIVPNTGVTWLDSTHAVLNPNVTTAYSISGYSFCSGFYNSNFVLNVLQPGQFLYTLPDSNICSGSSAYLSLSGISNIQISPFANLYYLDSTDAYTYLFPTANTTYTITGHGVCGGTVSASVNIYVSSAGGYTLSKPVVCNGDSTLMTLVGLTNGNISPSTGVSWIDATHLWLYPTTSTLYYITGYSVCAGSYYNTVNINVSTPVAQVVATNPTICASDSTELCATSGFALYHWNSGQNTFCFFTQAAGNYYVTITDYNGCTAESNHIAISVHQQPPVSISVNGDTMRVYNGLTWQWYLNGSPIAGATSNIYIASGDGFIQVAVTDSNGCVSTSNKVAIGIETINPDEIQVYPNPLSSGSFQLEVSNLLIGAEVQIFDDNGRTVYKGQIASIKSQIELEVASGVYLLRINSSSSSVVKKLVKL